MGERNQAGLESLREPGDELLALHRLEIPATLNPSFNPDEKAWSKTKAILRRMAQRTVDGLLAVIGQAISSITPQDCAEFFRHCGYG